MGVATADGGNAIEARIYAHFKSVDLSASPPAPMHRWHDSMNVDCRYRTAVATLEVNVYSVAVAGGSSADKRTYANCLEAYLLRSSASSFGGLPPLNASHGYGTGDLVPADWPMPQT